MARFILLSFILISSILNGQSIPAPLQKAKATIQTCPSYEVTFQFILEYPEQDKIFQKGYFLQSEGDFKLSIDSKTWLKNSSVLYFIDSEAQEVNINSLEDNDEILTPFSFLQNLDDKHYEFYVLDDKKGHEVYDLKPLDDVEYFKIRVSFTGEKISSVRVFNDDSSRFQFDISKSDCLEISSKQKLLYKKSDYPNYFIEDLRID